MSDTRYGFKTRGFFHDVDKARRRSRDTHSLFDYVHTHTEVQVLGILCNIPLLIDTYHKDSL